MLDAIGRQRGVNALKENKNLRVDLVRRIMLRGITAPLEIQTALLHSEPPLQLTLRTIYRYKGIIARRSIKAIRDKEGLNETIEQIVSNLKDTINEVVRELWKQYSSREASPGEKIAALREIRKAGDEWMKTLQSVGLVRTAPVQHQMLDKNGNPINPVEVDKAQIEQEFVAFIKAKFQEPLGVSHEDQSKDKLVDAITVLN